MNVEERIRRVSEAVDAEVRAHYGDQAPMRYGTLIGWKVGGPDPLHAMVIYAHPEGHWHYVTFGLAEHDDKESSNAAVSGWGFELTFRLRAPAGAPAEAAPRWPLRLLNDVARHVWETRRPLGHGHFIERPGEPAGPYWGVVRDPVLRPVDTVNGRFGWLQLVALDEPSFRRLQGDDYEAFLAERAAQDPLLVSSVVVPTP